MYSMELIEEKIDEILSDPRASLDAFCSELPKDRPIAEAERLERLYKKLLKHVAQSDDQDLAFAVAEAQKKIGFILKYKSYGIKATVPIGYSLFFLEPGEGFSFQRHVDFKTETFYFLATPPKSMAFLCESDEWERIYDERLFSQWLRGADVPRFDSLRHIPQPGDVMHIEHTGMVHTAIGCTLEEYANTSTDMVDRLYDQNKGRVVPAHFNRTYFLQRLEDLAYPIAHRLIERSGGSFVTAPLHWMDEDSVQKLTLMEAKTYIAHQIIVPANTIWHLNTNDRYVSCFVGEGHVECALSGQSLLLKQHDMLLGMPRCAWTITTHANPARLSIFAIQEQDALR